MILREGLTPPTRIFSKGLVPFLTRSWGHLWPSWARLGPFKPILKPTCHPRCCLQALKTTRRPPESHFASFLKACCLQKSAKNIDFPLVFLLFLTSQLLATLHHRSKPSKPKIRLKMPSRTPQEGPRRAQDSPRWAQDGPKKGRGTTGKSCKILFGALLGRPRRGHLEASSRLGRALVGMICGKKVGLQKPSETLRKSMIWPIS